MSLQAIPEGAQEEVYQLALLALKNNDLIEGLAEHYRQSADPVYLECEPVESYKEVLTELSHVSLAELFYETVISNDRFHPDSRQFYIDPKCTKAYSLDALQAHFYRNALASFLGAIRCPVSDESIDKHMQAISDAVLKGAHKIETSLGDLRADVSLTKFKVAIFHPYQTILQPRNELEALNNSFRQWAARLRGIDLNYRQEEALNL